MEEKKLTEKESLELISQMIQVTRQHIVQGSGNQFLIYGFTAVILSVGIYVLLVLTHNHLWALGWFLMFLPVMILAWRSRKKRVLVVTYTESVLKKVWQVVAALFYLTAFVMLVVGWMLGRWDFVLMLPLGLLYVSMGIAITGLVIRESYLIYTPFVGFLLAIYMLMSYSLNQGGEMIWHLYFGLSFVIMLIVPGYILNYKSKEQC